MGHQTHAPGPDLFTHYNHGLPVWRRGFKAYSLGLAKFAKGDQAELDGDFAIAYANLGRAHENLRQKEPMEEALRKAFALRGRTSEREKYDISAGYYQFVTNQPDESIQMCELWAQIYPVDFTPHRILGYEYAVLGRWDKSAQEYGKARELDPSQALPYSGLILSDMALNRLTEARAVYQEAQSRTHPGEPERAHYLLAFLEGDKEMMARAASLLAGNGNENKALLEESLTEAYFGHLGRAEELFRRAEDAALAEGDKTTAADMEATAAFLDALFGDSAGARRHVDGALGLGGQSAAALTVAGDWVQPTVALSLAADTALAEKLADRLATYAPPGGFASKVWLPEIRAGIEIKRGNSMRAVDLLAHAASYEAGWHDHFLAAYLRGEGNLAAHRGQEAAAEFKKIIDHRGVVLNSPIGALAHLGLARAYALAGDPTRARTAYRDFLTLWKDAEPGIPILIAAKSEDAKLK